LPANIQENSDRLTMGISAFDIASPFTLSILYFSVGGKLKATVILWNRCIEIFLIYWNHGAFCGHSLGKPHGMME